MASSYCEVKKKGDCSVDGSENPRDRKHSCYVFGKDHSGKHTCQCGFEW